MEPLLPPSPRSREAPYTPEPVPGAAAPAGPAIPPNPPARPRRDRATTAWLLAAVGVGIVLLAQALWVLAHLGDLAGEDRLPALFNLLGGVLLVGGMVAASVLHASLSAGARIALLVAGAYFAFQLAPSSFLGGFVGLAGLFN